MCSPTVLARERERRPRFSGTGWDTRALPSQNHPPGASRAPLSHAGTSRVGHLLTMQAPSRARLELEGLREPPPPPPHSAPGVKKPRRGCRAPDARCAAGQSKLVATCKPGAAARGSAVPWVWGREPPVQPGTPPTHLCRSSWRAGGSPAAPGISAVRSSWSPAPCPDSDCGQGAGELEPGG